MKKNVLISIVCFLILCCSNSGEDSIRLIPEGFEGPVIIVFNQKDGEPKEYDNGKRVYRIPKDGVLRTQFESNFGLQKHEFFYTNKDGDWTEIPFVIVQNKESLAKIQDKTKIFAFGERAPTQGSGYDHKLGNYTIPPTREFYIGNLTDIEGSYRELGKFSLSKLEDSRQYLD